jgi:glycosyltransferase involved in cell wall biosynthesis
MSFYIDFTEFLSGPPRTGIQRVASEMCRHLPSNIAVPIRLDCGHYIALSQEVMGLIGDHFTDSASDDIGRLAAPQHKSTISFMNDDVVLVPEVFFQRERLAFFRTMSDQEFERYRFVVYDLLPLTHPEYFVGDMPLSAICGYFRTIRRASEPGFISDHTRDSYYKRLKRTEDRGGVVLHLGADALGRRSGREPRNRARVFSVIGTIEPRKNHEMILDAFEPLLREIDGLSLIFMGRMGWVSPAFNERVHKLAADKDSGFTFISTANDQSIRQCIEECRATIYVSAVEGYGLPPIESLWVGTPVIASNKLPSLTDLGSFGIHIVDPPSVVSLRHAIRAFLDDGYAERKREEAMRLKLPTWRSFADEVWRWCSSIDQS